MILGLIVTIYPSATLNVIAVLFGLLMIVSGLFHLVRVFVSHEAHRVWMGISGLLLVVIGVVLLRDLHLTVALIGLIIGVTWIVQGMTALIVGFSGGEREGRGWWIFFGAVSLIGGVWAIISQHGSLRSQGISSAIVGAVILILLYSPKANAFFRTN